MEIDIIIHQWTKWYICTTNTHSGDKSHRCMSGFDWLNSGHKRKEKYQVVTCLVSTSYQDVIKERGYTIIWSFLVIYSEILLNFFSWQFEIDWWLTFTRSCGTNSSRWAIFLFSFVGFTTVNVILVRSKYIIKQIL